MASRQIPADERVQIVTQSMLEQGALTIRAAETGPDISVYGSQDDEGTGYPLRADDEWCIEPDDGPIGRDGLWMETDSDSSTDVQVLKGVCIRRNVRRQQSTTIDADTSGLLKSSDQPLDVSDATVDVQEATALDVSAATVPTNAQTPVGVEDSGGTQVDPVDESSMGPYTGRVTSTGNYASVSSGAYGSPATIVVDASGAGTLTVEVSMDNGTNWDSYTLSYDSSGLKEEVAGYGDVRAKADANLNALSISAKGV